MTCVNVKDIYDLFITGELQVSTEELRPSLDIKYQMNNSFVKVHNSVRATLAQLWLTKSNKRRVQLCDTTDRAKGLV